MKSGIYFLISRREIVYIGQSKNLSTRIKCHGDKQFDTIRVIECGIKKMAHYERRWILKFKPKYNKSLKEPANILPHMSIRLNEDEKKMLRRMCRKNNRSAGNQMLFAMKQQYYRQFCKSKVSDVF